MEILKKLLQLLSPLPAWLRHLLLALIGAIGLVLFALSSSSCGQVLKVTVRDTPNGVTISTSQNKADSTATNININPNITFPYGSR